LKAKASLGLHKARLVDIEQLSTFIGAPENVALGQRISDEAVTLVRENGTLLPLKPAGTLESSLPYQQAVTTRNELVVVILSEDVRTEAGRTLERQMHLRVPDANVLYVDPRIADAMLEEVLRAVREAKAVVAAVYLVPTAGKAIRSENGPTNSVSL